MVTNVKTDTMAFRADPGLREKVQRLADKSHMTSSELLYALVSMTVAYDQDCINGLLTQYEKSVRRIDELMQQIANNNATVDVVSGRFDERAQEVSAELYGK